MFLNDKKTRNANLRRWISRALLLSQLCAVAACSFMSDGEQFTNKTIAPSFVSQLYGNAQQSVSVTHENESHITWMGLVESNDYEYFKITKVEAGGQTVVSDGVDIGGETYVANSNATIEDLTIAPSSGDSDNEFVNGSINVGGNGDLKITVKYSPLKETTDEEPHEAYLLVYYDAPNVGSLRIKLVGYTRGMKDDKCARAAETMTPIVYSFKGNAFDFYFCGQEVASKGQANISSLPTDDPGYHGLNTNLTSIPAVDAAGQPQSLTFYQVDEETVCLLSSDLSGGDPSIPDFTFVIPEGLAPIDSLDIGMTDGSYAECALDGAGGILCDADILIDTGVVPVSALTATNGSFTAEELTTTQCSDFGTLSGSGAFADDEMTLVLKGTMLSDTNTQSYNIVDALVAAQIQLKCESGC